MAGFGGTPFGGGPFGASGGDIPVLPGEAITVEAPGGGAIVPPPTYASVGTTPPAVRFWVYEPGDDPSVWVELTKVLQCNTLNEISNSGSVTVTIMNDSPQLATIDGEKLIGVEYYGQVRAAGVVGQEKRISIAPEGEGGLTTTFTMPGIGELLREMVVAPWGGAGRIPAETTRLFDWRASDYLDFSWPDATVMAERTTTGGVIPPYWGRATGEAYPMGMLWANTCWIWSAAGTENNAPGGWCIFRSGFEVPVGVEYVVIMAAADNWGDVWLDGIPLFTNMSDFRKAQVSKPIPVSTGGHLLAALCGNAGDDGPPGGNPAGFICEVHSSNAAGTLTPPPSAGLLLHTDADWRCLDLGLDVGNAPGMPIGRIMRIVLYEAFLRGGLLLLPSFTDTVDSDGNPWPFVVDIGTNTGRTVFDFFRDLSETYIDFEVEPSSLRIHAWNRGTMGEVRPTVLAGHSDPLDPASGNLARLEHAKSW